MKKAPSLMRSLFYSEISCSSVKLYGLFCTTTSSYQEEIWLKPKPVYLLHFLLQGRPPEEQVTVWKLLNSFIITSITQSTERIEFWLTCLLKLLQNTYLHGFEEVFPLTPIYLKVSGTHNTTLRSMACKRYWRNWRVLAQGKSNWGKTHPTVF